MREKLGWVEVWKKEGKKPQFENNNRIKILLHWMTAACPTKPTTKLYFLDHLVFL